jgi:histidine triad (HIT) family protein
MSTIFGQIIRGELPCKKVFENDRVLAFHDIYPLAPVHILIIPKKEIVDLQSVSSDDLPIISEMISAARNIAKEFGIEKGYRLVINNGYDGGQRVFHLHFHLLGGKPLSHNLA